MKVMTAEEAERKFGISGDQVDSWEADIAAGAFHGRPRETVAGRPLMFGEEMRQVGFKEPVGKVAVIDRRAADLGLGRSEYLRRLVDADLELAGMA